MKNLSEKLRHAAREGREGMRRAVVAMLTGVMLFTSMPVEALAEGTQDIMVDAVTAAMEVVPDAAGADDGTNGPSTPTGDTTTGDVSQEPALASYTVTNDLAATTIEGDATASKEAAAEALRRDAGLDEQTARDAADALFYEYDESEGVGAPVANALPSDGSGDDVAAMGSDTLVDKLVLTWMTLDSEYVADESDNVTKKADFVDYLRDDDALLYYRPTSDAKQSLRMRVSFSLSGEHDYAPGDISISVPTYMFTGRDNKVQGTMVLAVPENPSTTGEWSYKRDRNQYVITNTRTMDAATQGYIEFAVEDIVPHDLVDFKGSEAFTAKIDVVTDSGEVVSRDSDNELYAYIDTHAEVTSATKRQSGEIEVVEASEIPEAQRMEGETHYVVVTWYMNAFVPTDATSSYTLELTDTVGETAADAEDVTLPKGFIIDEQAAREDAHPTETTMTVVDNGFKTGDSAYSQVRVAYPHSQFQKDHIYTFNNSVAYKLTETDADAYYTDAQLEDDLMDTQKVTTAEADAKATWHYEDPVFIEPSGHYNVFKYGVCATTYGDGLETFRDSDGGSVSDLSYMGVPGWSPYNGYWGQYPSALNDLHDGDDTTVSFTINTVGYLFPWTYEAPEEATGDNPQADLNNYGKRSVTMTTEDTGMKLMETTPLTPGEDYVYESVEFPRRPNISKVTAIRVSADGNVYFGSAHDGAATYVTDDNFTKTPDVILQVKRGDTWEDYARASWSETSNLKLTYLTTGPNGESEGTEIAGTRVPIPADVDGVRTQVTASNASVRYYIRVHAKLLEEGAVAREASHQFDDLKATNPNASVWNYTTMTATQPDAEDPAKTNTIVSIDKYAFVRLMGYTTDMRASLSKTSSDPELDYDSRQATIHYTTRLAKQSFISDERTFAEAMASGDLEAEEGGTFYDLLPKGMVPVLDTVELRDGDRIRELYTIEDYQGSGRTLLVVSADLDPQTVPYEEADLTYYEDLVTLEFDAVYSFSSILDFGNDPRNVVAYRSDNETLGTIAGYRGEVGPAGTDGAYNSNTTQAAMRDDEVDLMQAVAQLAGSQGEENWLYAGADCNLETVDYGLQGLTKEVMVNNNGVWTTGVEANGDPCDVYAGGTYQYRLGVRSGEESTTKDIVLYDVLEAYKPTRSNNEGIDVNTPSWRGTLMGVDVSSLVEAGCAPTVYVSTQSQLVLEEGGVAIPGEDAVVTPDENTTDLSNTSIWQPLSSVTDLSQVTAVAIDARKAVDGSDFVLDAEKSLGAYITMRAPSGMSAEQFIASDAHAFNNVYLASTTQGKNEGEPHNDFVRRDYTKVGLVAYELDVRKAWDDDNDRDGLRPDAVKVHLYADLQDGEGARPAEQALPAAISAEAAAKTLSAENDWQTTFSSLPYYADSGDKIIYSVREENVPEGYVASVAFDGEAFTVTNRHETARVTVRGTKTWVGDTDAVRPDAIEVELLADGRVAETATVRADANGAWNFTFEGLNRYTAGDDGVPREIVYTVREKAGTAPSYSSEVSGDAANGFTITNTYSPYGDLKVSKTVEGASEAVQDKTYTFTFEFTRDGEPETGALAWLKSLFTGEQEVPQEPVFDAFTYRVFNAAGEEQAGRTGTVSTNGSLELKAGEYAVVYDIPEGVHYTVTEASAAGFTQTSTGAVGTITPNETAEARFVNTYDAEGVAYLEASKQLTGRKLTPYQFMFSVYEVAEDGSETLVRTASNGAADEAQTDVDEQGNPVSVAPVTFGGISYGAQDSGKTFTYRIAETPTTQGGYTCDTTSYYAYVTPTDHGDGTMDVAVKYKTSDGQTVEDPDSTETGVVFRNSYAATGSLGLQVHKELRGGTLAADQFTFALGRVGGTDDAPTFDQVSTAKNAADGSVTFEDLAFTQLDAGKTYIYAIREFVGADSADNGGTVVYDEHVAYVQVTVTDNGNGTLSVGTKFSGFEAPCVSCGGTGLVEGDACPACQGSKRVTASTDDLTFENNMVDGGLEIVKTVPEGEEVDPNQPFTFHVELTNEQGEELNVENIANSVTIEPVDGGNAAGAEADTADDGATVATDQEGKPTDDASTPTAAASDASNPVLDFFSGAADFLIGLVAPTPAYAYWAGDDEAWHDEGTWSWNFDGSTLTLSGEGIACTEHSDDYHAFTWSGEGNSPYPEEDSFNASEVYKVVFEEGATFGPIISRLFDGMKNLQTIVGLEHMDTSNVTDMSYMFNLCSKVDSDDLKAVASFKTSSVTDMRGMFYGCSKLDELDVSKFDTSCVTKMTSMFSGCKLLKKLDVSKFDTSRVTTMASMFNGCSSLETLDVSSFKTSNVTTMASMFKNCSSLSGTIDLSGFSFDKVTTFANMFENDEGLTEIRFPKQYDTPVLTTMESMFSGCSQVKSLDVTQFDTEKVTSLAWTFYNCESIQTLDLSQWNTTSVTDMKYLFSGCGNLELITFPVGGWDTSKVKNMTQLFYRTAVTSLDLSSWDTSNVENMSAMFSHCSDLTTITFGDSFSLKKVTSISSMFSNCSSLAAVDLTNFVSNGSLDLSYLFSGCRSLTEIDLSGLTGQAEDIEGMFENCTRVRSVDIGGLAMQTDDYWEYYRAFANCNSLSSITLSDCFKFYHGGSTSWPNIERFPNPKVGSGEWVRLDESGKPQMDTAMSHYALWSNYPHVNGGAGTWVWNSFIDIRFDANGGAGSMLNQSIDTLKPVTLNKNEDSITKSNALFEGWNTRSDGTGDFYADGATIEAETFITKVDSVTLYAQWRDLQSVVAGTDGVLTITMPAGHHAVIPNLPAGTSYRVWEETESGWQLVQTSGTAGAIAPNETATASFTNSQNATSAYARIAAKKLLDGAWAGTEDGFQFTLTDTTEGSSTNGQGQVVQTVAVGAGGNVEFAPIEYTEAGVYTYELCEVTGDDAAIDYDGTVVPVRVTVEEDDEGHMSASVAYGDPAGGDTAATEVPVFTNVTKPGSLTITKLLSDTVSPATETVFSFRLTLAGLPYEGAYAVGDDTRNAADGIITLKGGETATVAGLAPGTTYAVEEIDVPDGWTLGSATGDTGTIAPADAAAATFTNTYAASGSVQLMAYKDMPNGAIADGQFRFELLDAEGSVLGTAVNGPVDTSATMPDPDGEGEIDNPAYGKAAVWFPTIAYTQEDAGETFIYTMREVVPDDAVNAAGVRWGDAYAEQQAEGGFTLNGICYDSSPRTATVTVADNGDGTLLCTVTYGDSAGANTAGNTFVNTLETGSLIVQKVVTNDNLDHLADAVQNASFTFTIGLKDAAGKGLEGVAGTVRPMNAEAGDAGRTITVSDGGTFQLASNEQVVFDDLPYGTTYEVIETPRDGWTQVADQTSGTHGTLSAEGAVATIANRYDAHGVAELKAFKKFDGTLTDGQFSFALLNTTAGTPGVWLQETTNDSAGLVSFEPIAYTTEDAGKTFSYQIFETNTVDSGIAFDKSVVDVKVAVTDRGDGTLQCDVTYNGEADPYTFKNLLSATLARTGGPGITLAGVALVALGCVAFALHKRTTGRSERSKKVDR